MNVNHVRPKPEEELDALLESAATQASDMTPKLESIMARIQQGKLIHPYELLAFDQEMVELLSKLLLISQKIRQVSTPE